MRRLSRILLNAATVFSLALVVATPFVLRPELRFIRYPGYRWGLLFFNRRWTGTSSAMAFAIPLGVMGVFAALPVLRLLAKVRRTFRLEKGRDLLVRGRCPSCGYDLRGTPLRCPECGTVPTAQEARLGSSSTIMG